MAPTEAQARAGRLARAYGFLRWAFLPGDPRAFAVLTAPEAAAALEEAAPLLARAPAAHLEAFARVAEEFPSESEMREAYEVAFRGARLVSPFETDYTTATPFEQANELADIAGFYRAFNLAWQSATVDRVDHVGSELEFLCIASWMEAKAIKEGRAQDAEVAARAHRSFLIDHAGRWAGPFAQRCQKRGAALYFQAAAALAAALVAEDMHARGVTAKSVSPSVLPMA